MSPPKKSTLVWLVVGAVVAFLVGGVVPGAVIGAVTRLPVDAHAVVQARSPEVELERTLSTAPGAESGEVQLSAHTVVTADGGVLLEIDDTAVLVAGTGLPVMGKAAAHRVTWPEQGEIATSDQAQRDGITHTFPSGTLRQSYPFFDELAGSSYPIDYVTTLKETGSTLEVYEFHQERTGLPLDTQARYDVSRQVFVEPKTGTILDHVTNIHVYDAAEPASSYLRTTLAWDEDTTTGRLEAVESQLRLFRFLEAIGWLGTAVGVIALAAAVYQVVRLRRISEQR